jgi:hypothetical protein
MDPFSAAGRLFQPQGSLQDKTNLVFVDAGLVSLMVAEGYVAAAGKGYAASTDAETLERCAAAADYLSHADVLDKRVYRTQSWDLMAHASTMTAAAATTAAGPAPFQLWPQWLGKASKRGKHRTWVRDLETRSSLSYLDAQDLLRARFFQSGRTATAVVDDLLSLRLTRDDLMDTLTDVTLLEGKAPALDSKTKAAVTREWTKRCGKAEKAEKAEKVADEEGDDESDEDIELS